jgi:hypothetical protein
MSEFSESFHFPRSKRDDVAAKLKAAGMKGVLYGPSRSGWVTFVPYEGCQGHQFLAGMESQFGGKLSALASNDVLEWVYAEDHEWHAMLWRRGELVAHYSCDWNDDEVRVEASDRAIAELASLPAEPNAQGELTDALAHDVDEDMLFEHEPPAYRFAQALGLPQYEWTSSQYATADGAAAPTDGGFAIGSP